MMEFTETMLHNQHIIIGYPIYGSGMPENMRKVFSSLPLVQNKKKISVLCTQASFSGDGSVYVRAELERKGYDVRQCLQINMTTNFNVGKFPFSKFKPATGKKLIKVKARALRKIRNCSKMILRNQEYFDGTSIAHVCVGPFMRFGFTKESKKLLKDFKFFKDKCIKCKLCVKTCPTNCLSMEPPGMDLIRNENCVFCFRCYNFCPKNAIGYGHCSAEKDKFIRYKGPEEKPNISAIRQ